MGGDWQRTGPTSAPSKRSGTRVVTLLLLGVLITLVIAVFRFHLLGDRASGRLAVSGGPHGEFTFVAKGCAGLQQYGKAGVDVHGNGPNDGGVYVFVTILGKGVQVEVPGSCKDSDGTDCTVFNVPRDRCSVWKVDAHFNGTVANDVREYSGSLHLRCKLDDGTRVTGDLEYNGCGP